MPPPTPMTLKQFDEWSMAIFEESVDAQHFDVCRVSPTFDKNPDHVWDGVRAALEEREKLLAAFCA